MCCRKYLCAWINLQLGTQSHQLNFKNKATKVVLQPKLIIYCPCMVADRMPCVFAGGLAQQVDCQALQWTSQHTKTSPLAYVVIVTYRKYLYRSCWRYGSATSWFGNLYSVNGYLVTGQHIPSQLLSTPEIGWDPTLYSTIEHLKLE